ncbi:hypothetical protein [Methylocapsa aurea]|uniref:hypothetical protein n=1 Tax=Methylocapsa aurea TaxID=663610 RepID=UPI00056A635B|nr:hypothetical protein [Methylocapsa aurea]
MLKKAISAGPAHVLALAASLGLALAFGPALAQQPTAAQTSAIRSACQSDYRANCASVPPGGSAALACLQKNAANLSPACKTAVNAVGGAPAPAATTAAAPSAAASPAPASPAASSTATGAASAPAAALAPTPAPAKPATPPQAFPPLSPREELMVLRNACGADFRALCAGVQLGQGRAIGCLRANGPSLSDRCKGALMRASQR